MSESPDLSQRLTYLDLGPSDLDLLQALRPLLEEHAGELVDTFYRHLQSFAPTRKLLRDPAVKKRLLAKQHEYLLSLAEPEFGEDFLERSRRLGSVHERVALEPRWYLGACALYFSMLAPLIQAAHPDDPDRTARTLVALQKRCTSASPSSPAGTWEPAPSTSPCSRPSFRRPIPMIPTAPRAPWSPCRSS
jgi:hypothetical protein